MDEDEIANLEDEMEEDIPAAKREDIRSEVDFTHISSINDFVLSIASNNQ